MPDRISESSPKVSRIEHWNKVMEQLSRERSFGDWDQTRGKPEHMAKDKTPVIMILEDDPDFGPLLQMSLEDAGYRVSLHTDATSALEFIDDNDVDLVISDLLIKQDGKFVQDGGIKLISALKQVRHHPAPVIAISGSFVQDQYHAISTAMTVGADRTLAKPVGPDELIDLIKTYL
ncbi:response regulator [Erythrobacter sp. YT30]|uniref:response regulator n=1 Tax=Erythrobacter sp. YT30 TaxID=1735012 RepID=UPI0009E85CB1|nr:response regulator [Erythrobacter sp. YT30]